MIENTENLRAILLVRVSSDKQDETMQVNVGEKFCKNNNMIVVDIYRELDVSGFKTPLDKRVGLLQVLKRAEEKKDFDAVIFYLHDRIGRREDETPSIVPAFAKLGIRCFDATNGSEIKVDTHVDKLMNYMNSWTSEYESIKTSSRVKDGMATKNLTTNYNGGIPPYGYEITYTDLINNKGKLITKLSINEYEADVIVKIFDLATNYNYGSIKIAEYLNSNGYINRPKIVIDKENNLRSYKSVFFRSNSINRILHNSVYIGRKIYNKTRSERDNVVINNKDEWKLQPYNEELRIIEDSTFESANKLIDKRKKEKNKHVQTSTSSGVLCSGLAFCICGSKLKSDYSIKKYVKKNLDVTETKTYRYICMDGSNDRKTHKIKYGTSVYYSAKKYDDIVKRITIEEIDKINQGDGIEYELISLKKDIERIKKTITLKEIEVKDSKLTITKFENLIDKEIINDGNIDIYTKGIKRNIDKIILTSDEIELLNNEIDLMYQRKSDHAIDYKNMINFKENFESADFNLKKVLLSNIVDRVTFKNNGIDLQIYRV